VTSEVKTSSRPQRKRTPAQRDISRYMKLIEAFPLRPLTSKAELKKAQQVIDTLLDKGDLADDEQDYLDVLSDLVERYEDQAYPFPSLPDGALLRHLMDAGGVRQTQVAKDTEIASSTISEVLSNRRRLTREHIGKLCRYFSVSPDVFTFE
jgi:HTH-type transcriptional regulator/antitoxin HigA